MEFTNESYKYRELNKFFITLSELFTRFRSLKINIIRYCHDGEEYNVKFLWMCSKFQEVEDKLS